MLEKVVKENARPCISWEGCKKGKKGSQSGVTRDPSRCALHTPTFSFPRF